VTSVRVNNESARNVERVLAQIDALSPLPPVASHIAALTQEAAGDTRRIVELLATVPTLSARVRSILGGPDGRRMPSDGWPMSFGHGGDDDARRGGPIIASPTSRGGGPPDLDEAVRLYGAGAVRQIALALVVMDAFANGQIAPNSDTAGPDHAALHRHGLAVAFAAKGIATALDTSTPPAELFACALVHDLGKVAVRVALPKSFERIAQTCERTRADIADVERELLGIDHTGIGRHLAMRWGLPRRWVECIWLHHQSPEALPASIAEEGHVRIVQLADTMAREQRLGYSGTHGMAASSHALAERLGLPDVERVRIIESLPAELARQASLESPDGGEGPGEWRSSPASVRRQSASDGVDTDYLSSLHSLNQSLSPHAAVREVCPAAAAAVCQALSVRHCAVFVTSEDGRWVEEAISDGRTHIAIEPRRLDGPVDARAADAVVELAAAGTWIAPPPAAFTPVVDRYRGRLGEDPVWLMPIVVEHRWVGGAVFAATASHAATLRAESDEIEILVSAMGLALVQARARAEARALGDELAEVSRKLASTQDELLQGRTLERVAAMAAGAAHELNSPLAVISGRAQLLRRQAGAEEVRNIAEAIAVQASVCSEIVTELMDFARGASARGRRVASVHRGGSG